MKVTKFFQSKGVDISNAKSMFEFINEHYKYFTMNSWNGLKSIANLVKIYALRLSGNPWTALHQLEAEEYLTVNEMIRDWEAEHPGYAVGFNGRSSGYLVLYNKDNMKSVIPDDLDGYDSYEDWKEDIHDWGYTTADFMPKLRELTNLVRDFDKLCDEIRDYVDMLSDTKFETTQMENDVATFNDLYAGDLARLGYKLLEMDQDGKVDISEISQLVCLLEAFIDLVNEHKSQGYRCAIDVEKKTAQIVEDD